MSITKSGPHIFKWIFSVFVLLLLFEGGLRITGYFLHWQQLQTSQIKDSSFTILAVGESTTAGAEAWPALLQTKLQEQGLKVQVVNESQPGTNTTLMVTRLATWYEQYHPKILITMMGINDLGTGLTNKYGPLAQESFWKNLRVVKLAAFLVVWVKQTLGFSSQSLRPHTDVEIPEEAIEMVKQRRFNDLHSRYGRWISSESGLNEDEKIGFVSGLMNRSDGMNFLLHAPEYEGFYFFSRPVLPFVHRYAFSRDFLTLAVGAKKIDDCQFFLQAVLRDRIQIPDMSLMTLKNCLGEKNQDLQVLLEQYNLKVNEWQEISKVLKKNYLTFFDFAKDKGICWVVMQYPLRDVETLQSFFQPEQLQVPWLKFVSNKKNYQEALKKMKFEDIFADRFAVDFGHPTLQGHQLIAENLVPTLQELIRQGVCKAN